MASSSSSVEGFLSDYEKETFTSSKKSYDAFINHRGPDTKDTVALALYDSLEEMGFWTFLDDQELQLGDSISSAIQNAIWSSSVQIPIFSPRYAESSWCLDELLLMFETQAAFIPIFCDVRPIDVRYPERGVYAAAFEKHERKGRFSRHRINQWKAALHSSSLVSGYEFSTSNDNVGMLCTRIALAVQEKVGKTFRNFPIHMKAAKDQIGIRADAAASTSTSVQVKKCRLLSRDSHPVGIHSNVEQLLGLLENSEDQVIAVVGMGGLGKTLLLQNVYKALKSRFDNSICLSVSKSYSVKNLKHDLAFQIGLRSKIVDGAKSEETVTELIHDRLQGKKSLIVLDDLWTLSTEDDLFDELGLPADKDCKVVVSTRNRKVAIDLGAQIYEMKNLSDEDSWRLFCVYAFPRSVGNRGPYHLEEEGRRIVRKCGNLPLAIKTIAASLANTTLRIWELKRLQLERIAIPFGGHDTVMDILKLSYDSLPAHLKACFAFLSFFPEDAEIDPEYLVYLWIGEGFVPAGEEQWDTAWDWLDQLAQLCLLELWENWKGKLTKYCKIHDLLHDLAINISRENKCVFSVEEASKKTIDASGWCRILLAKKDINDDALSPSLPAYLRALSLSQNREIGSIPENLFSAMRGLRVLDLSSTGISALPASVGKMILLKVLNLRDTWVDEVPECVKYLKSLIFLALSDSCRQLPVWISELKCLQHLECDGIEQIPKGISKLASLRTLRPGWLKVPTEKDEFMRLEDLANMTQLQEVWLTVMHKIELKRIEEGILVQLVEMRRVGFINWSEIDLPHLPANIRVMKHLESLTLESFAVPSWICDLANLRELKLDDCECSDYPELQVMPNLVSLYLKSNDLCRKLPKAFGKSGAFPNLRFFIINKLYELEEFPELEEGAMTSLEEFRLLECPNVEKVEGLERLKNLKLFSWQGSGTDTLWDTLQEGGIYWNKIKAINPGVIITEM